MKNIKVLGTGCTKCKKTIAILQEVAAAQHAKINLEKVEDPMQIMQYGVMSTPAILINEKLVHKGSVPNCKLVEQWLTE